MDQKTEGNSPQSQPLEAKHEVSTGPVQPSKTQLMLAGYAVLGKDDITGFKMWKTFDGQGSDHVNMSPAQPLVFPVAKLPIGTRVDLFIPVTADDNTQEIQVVPGGDQSQKTTTDQPSVDSPK